MRTAVVAIERIIKGTDISRELAEEIARQAARQAEGSSHIAAALDEISRSARELEGAAREQVSTTALLHQAAAPMGRQAAEVRLLTGEQAEAVTGITLQIGKAAETARDLAAKARRAEEEIRGFNEAVDVIREVLAGNQQNALSLEAAVDLLGSEAEKVRSSLAVFKLS